MDSFSSKGLKGIFTDMTTVFTRAKQYAEETIGTAERTELDQQYESLAEKADIYKQWTERIVAKLEAVVQPNPNMRYGDLLIERMGTEIRREDRLRNLEYLGNDMIDAGIAFGPSTVYGNALVKVGKTQQALGQTEKDFVVASYRTFIIPFRKFIDEDMKTITKERNVLQTKRLDLDAAKSRLRKAKSMDSVANAEREVKRAQEEFERQIEITKLLLEGLGSAQANHVRCLNDFVTQQIEFYNQCYRHMLNLQREISYSNNSHRAASFSGSTTSSTAEGLHHHHHHLPSVYPSLSPASALSPTNNATTQSPSRGGSVSPSLSSVRHSTANVNANTPSASVLDSTTSSSQQPATLNCSEQLSFPPRPSPTSSVDSSSHQLLMSSSSNCEGVNYQHFSHPNASATSVAGSGGGGGGKRRARALNDYVPLEVGELSLRADEIIQVEHSSALDPAHMMGERTNESGSVERGKVPVAYLEILN